MTDELRRLWDAEWSLFRYGGRIYGKTAEEAADEIEEMLPRDALRGKRVLDAGCGFGRATIVLRERSGARVFASDISQAALRRAAEAGLPAFQADIERLPVRSGVLDIAFAHGVLLYLRSPRRAVREMARVVKPGGCIAFSIWPPFPLWARAGAFLLRGFTRRLPLAFARGLAYLLAPLHPFLHRASGLRRHEVGFDESAHIMFNMLTAPWLQQADRATVQRWVEEAGCRIEFFGRREVRVAARKTGGDSSPEIQ